MFFISLYLYYNELMQNPTKKENVIFYLQLKNFSKQKTNRALHNLYWKPENFMNTFHIFDVISEIFIIKKEILFKMYNISRGMRQNFNFSSMFCVKCKFFLKSI